MSVPPAAAAVYTRISKDIEGKGLGVQRQRELCEKLADEKGWPIANVYSDNDLGAYSGKPRPAYEQMVADIGAGSIDAVICVDIDRLTRRPSELETFITLADSHSIALANVSGDIDLSTSDGRFRARIMGAVARQESEKKSERIKRQKDQSASQGWATGGKRRYGYEWSRTETNEATMELVPDEADIIREMADRIVKGGSLHSIAQDLNNRQVPTAKGNQWWGTTVRTILRGGHIAGLRTHHGQVVGQGNWTPILDRATFELVQAQLDASSTPGTVSRSVYLLTGFLECSKCSGTMYHQTRFYQGRGGYVCHPKPGSNRCGGTTISAVPAERIVSDAVVDWLGPARFGKPISPPAQDQGHIVSEIESVEARMSRLSELHFGEGRMTEREYLSGRDAMESKLRDLRKNLLPDTAPALVYEWSNVDPRQLWDNSDMEKRRNVIRAVVDKIIVKPGTPGRQYVDPDRLDIRWKG